MILHTILFTIAVTGVSLFVVYYWSFFHFSQIFEDRVIDEYTFAKKQDMGVENEWILGVTTDSIDVVQGIHKDNVANTLKEKAEKQKEPEKLYRETIDGKHLLYTIRLDTNEGETLYHYSIIKDIYAEIFPHIVMSFLTFFIFLTLISLFYIHMISKGFYEDISILRSYTKKIAEGSDTEPLEISTKDDALQDLVSDLCIMKESLDKEAAMRQTTLQYISHEMKTPIMIIEGYAASAIDGIYPKGTPEESMKTIIAQTERMKQKVQDLLTIVRLESAPAAAKKENIAVKSYILHILTLLNQEKKQNVFLHIPEEVIIEENQERFKILVENLITNQLKYAKTFLSVSYQESAEKHILYFYNDGVQIPEEIRKTLFQPFVKGYNGSSGLGLSICKSIMNQIGGSIFLKDTKKGTLIVVEFLKETDN